MILADAVQFTLDARDAVTSSLYEENYRHRVWTISKTVISNPSSTMPESPSLLLSSKAVRSTNVLEFSRPVTSFGRGTFVIENGVLMDMPFRR